MENGFYLQSLAKKRDEILGKNKEFYTGECTAVEY